MQGLWLLLGMVVLVVMLAPVALPEGVPRSYDWDLQIIWITQFYEALGSGAWWPQWASGVDGGRGAPVFVFYPPLAYYLTSLWMTLSESPVMALKLGLGSAALIACLTSLRLFKGLVEGWIAVVLALCVALSPAWLFMAFRVHMLAGVLALAFLPLALDGVLRMRTGGPVAAEGPGTGLFLSRYGLQVAAAIGLIGWTHLPMLLMSVVAVLLLVLMLWPDLKGQRVNALSGLTLGLALAAAPMTPALLESGLISLHALQSDALDWKRNFLFSKAMISGPRGFRFDHVFLSIFAAAWLLFIAFAFWMVSHRHGAARDQKALMLWACALFLLTTPLAWPVYALVPALQMLQFPWRWLPLAHAAGLVVLAVMLGRMSRPLRIVVICGVLALSGHIALFLDVGLVVQQPRTSPQEERWVVETVSRIAPEYRPRTLRLPSSSGTAPAVVALADNRDIRITTLDRTHAWQVETRAQGVLHLGMACFPGWVVRVEGEKVETGCDAQGLLTVAAPLGAYRVDAEFTTTPIRKIGRAVSLMALLFWLRLVWRSTGQKAATAC